MTWLVLLPAVLGACVVLTDMAHKAVQGALKPKPCQHPGWMYNRCIVCGSPR